MGDTKSDRLGVRGILAHFESGLRLLGGANATGALASGVTYHAFDGNAAAQSTVKWAGLLFMCGLVTFTVAFFAAYMATVDADRSLRTGEKETLEQWLLPANESVAYYKKSARTLVYVMALAGFLSFSLFLFGLGQSLIFTLRL